MTKKYETQYAIVGKHGRKDCQAAVMTFIEAGWFPFGGIAVDRDYFAQAMSRSVLITETKSADEDRQVQDE